MNEKEARKRLKAIETEIRYLEKMLERQKMLDGLYSRKFNIKGPILIALVGAVVVFMLIYNTGGGADISGIACTAFFFILFLAFLLMIVFVFRERTENRAWEMKRGMECWLQYYRKEKEKILRECPNLKYEDIKPSPIHYWVLLQYCAIGAYLIVFGLFAWTSSFYSPNPVTPYLLVLLFIMNIITYLHRRHYRNCPHR